MKNHKPMIRLSVLILILSLLASCTNNIPFLQKRDNSIQLSILKRGSGKGKVPRQDLEAKTLFEQAHPGVHISFIYADGNTYRDRLNELIAANKARFVPVRATSFIFTTFFNGTCCAKARI